MEQIERERVFLLNSLPPDINKCGKKNIEVGDFSAPNVITALRIRRKGNDYELIRKQGRLIHRRTEQVLKLTKKEFEMIYPAAAYKHQKVCFYYRLGKNLCEIDVYSDKLLGYARVEVEFKTEQALRAFTPPSWFGPEITKINHSIHKNLGSIDFRTLKARFLRKGIKLKPIKLK